MGIEDKKKLRNAVRARVALIAADEAHERSMAMCDELERRIDVSRANFYPYDKDAMAAGAYGINEPQEGAAVNPCEIDVIIVPGVAFTVHGARMGRGKGYYDRFLSQSGFAAMKVGVCYSEQIVDDIPTEPHDVMMDAVIYK